MTILGSAIRKVKMRGYSEGWMGCNRKSKQLEFMIKE
jgi:hypothetical protein